jgi:hypothetical protein
MLEAEEEQMAHLGVQESEPDERFKSLQRDLPKIDFKSAIRDFQAISGGFNNQGGAALFLLQKGLPMGADYCLARIRDLLSEMTAPGNFKSYPVAPTPATPFDTSGLVGGLGSHFGVKVTPECVEQSLQEIIARICGLVQTGTIVLLEFTGWDYYQPRHHVAPWFLERFWNPLISNLPQIAIDYPRVMFVGVLIAEGEIRKRHLPPSIFCTRSSFSSYKILELHLKKCSLEEIREWLARFSKLKSAQIDALAETIYNATGGKLSLVCEALKKHLA